ncbi:hypothetical protein BGP75_17350 [Motiliproteus sp. MSK22-1]|nr:hypothetical protein BGP75_17350 [Motiliproteus sp. MSK22-1]
MQYLYPVKRKNVHRVISLWVILCCYAVPVKADNAENLEQLLLSEDSRSLTEAGLDFQHGRGVEQDLERAIQCLCVAANLGYAPAQYELGWLYLNRRHGRDDQGQGAVWLKKAADQGDDHAQRLLSLMGTETDQDARCPLPDGRDYLLPLKTKPNPTVAEIVSWVERLAPEYGLSPQLVLEVIRAESNFNVKALSNKEAMGLMQLIPRTAKRFGVKDVWDPLQNIHGGMAYLRWLLTHFDGDIKLALAGYNAGEKAVQAYQGIPPYGETQRYVRLIIRKLDKSENQ